MQDSDQDDMALAIVIYDAVNDKNEAALSKIFKANEKNIYQPLLRTFDGFIGSDAYENIEYLQNIIDKCNLSCKDKLRDDVSNMIITNIKRLAAHNDTTALRKIYDAGGHNDLIDAIESLVIEQKLGDAGVVLAIDKSLENSVSDRILIATHKVNPDNIYLAVKNAAIAGEKDAVADILVNNQIKSAEAIRIAHELILENSTEAFNCLQDCVIEYFLKTMQYQACKDFVNATDGKLKVFRKIMMDKFGEYVKDNPKMILETLFNDSQHELDSIRVIMKYWSRDFTHPINKECLFEELKKSPELFNASKNPDTLLGSIFCVNDVLYGSGQASTTQPKYAISISNERAKMTNTIANASSKKSDKDQDDSESLLPSCIQQ